jgi:hypothetical protein
LQPRDAFRTEHNRQRKRALGHPRVDRSSRQSALRFDIAPTEENLGSSHTQTSPGDRRGRTRRVSVCKVSGVVRVITRLIGAAPAANKAGCVLLLMRGRRVA